MANAGLDGGAAGVRQLTPEGLGDFVGQYSYAPGVVAGDFVFVAGQVPLDGNDELVGVGDIGAQTRQALARVELVLKSAGASLPNIVSTMVFIRSFDLLEEFDRAWAEVFGEHRAARVTVAAGLYRPDCLIEVQATAYLPKEA